MLAAAVFSVLSLIPTPEFDFRTYGPYRTEVPTPNAILGYEIGQKHTVFFDQERVVYGIAKAAPDRVRPFVYGKSTEGRPLRVFAVSSPENIAKLDQIREDQKALAHSSNPTERQAAATRVPAIVWINECIHGDETASFESGMELLYALAASNHPDIVTMLRNTVVIVNPAYNPDGHERYVVAYNSIPQGNPEDGSYDTAVPSAFHGRSNHYRFDMNRDRIAMSQAETRQEVAEFLRWNPHVYVDQHGQVQTYFFPPVQQSVNINTDRERYNRWTETFGRATAQAFDRQGWTYYIRDQFDFFNVCYLDTHTTLMGAIGMTHETDGGRVLSRRRGDGTILTFRDGIAKHFVSALAVIKSAGENREKLVASYAAFKEKAISGSHAGKFKRVVLTSDDPRPLKRLAEHLGRSGIVSRFAGEAWSQARAHDYWSEKVGRQDFPAGSLIVDMNQSQGPLAKALLEPFAEFEPEFIQRQLSKAKSDKEGRPDPELDSYEFYDSTAWALPYAYNLAAWWCEDQPDVSASDAPTVRRRSSLSTVGYRLDYRDIDDIRFAEQALRDGLKVSLATKQMNVGGEIVPAGAFLFLAARNRDGFGLDLVESAFDSGVSLVPLRTSYPDVGRHGPGSDAVVHLRPPVVGVVYGSSGNLQGGSLWYLLEQEIKMPYRSLSSQAAAGNLDDYTCIVVPGSLPSSSIPALRTWVQAGGTLVVLDGMASAVGEDKFLKLSPQSGEVYLPGALFRANLDPTSLLSYGYPRRKDGSVEVAVPIEGEGFFKAPKSGSAITLSPDEKFRKLLCGWQWSDTETALRGTTWLVEERVGRGKVILFSQDPTYRAQYPGLYRLLMNAMILSPNT